MRLLMMSGEVLGEVEATSMWTVDDVREAAQRWVGSSHSVEGIVIGTQEVREGGRTLEKLGIRDGTEVHELMVIVGGIPKLHLSKTCSAGDLSARLGWAGDDEDVSDGGIKLFRPNVQHAGFDTAPTVAREIAEKMENVAPNYKDREMVKSVANDVVGCVGEIFIISSPGPDTKKTCVEALGFNYTEDIAAMTVVNKDNWKVWLDGKICDYDMDEDEGFGNFEPHPDIKAITTVMSDEANLKNHFKFYFGPDEAILCDWVPVMFGGYTEDGSIVGLVSSVYLMV